MHPRITMHPAATLISILLAGASAAAQPALSDARSRDEGFRSQMAIERVYWSHRSGGGETSFELAVPDTVVARKAADGVLKTSALRRFWEEEITPEQLQAELDRMATHTKSPARLLELFAAVGNDPAKAAEYLARPALADRLIRTHYARDERLHNDTRARAEREIGELGPRPVRERTTRLVSAMKWRRGNDGPRIPGVVDLEPEEFDARVRELRRTLDGSSGNLVIDRVSPLREDETRFSAIIVHTLDDEQVELTTIEWPKRSFDEWWSETRNTLRPEPEKASFEFRLPMVAGANCIEDTWRPTLQLLEPRYWHTAVWTGSEMIVFGGMSAVGNIYGDGSRYDPATDTWTLLPATGSPGPRQSHAAVWTGTEMIVWGGVNDLSGARYNPSTDTWAETSTVNAPPPRRNASVVWTGTEMIVWGGDNGGAALEQWGPLSTGDKHVDGDDDGAARAAGLSHGRLDRLADDHLGRLQRSPRAAVRRRRALQPDVELLGAGRWS